MTTSPPTYDDAVDDATAVIDEKARLAATSHERGLLRIIRSELRSLCAARRAEREMSEREKAQRLLDDIASRVIEAALFDWKYAEQTSDVTSPIIAQVPFSTVQVSNWCRYAISRGVRAAAAREILTEQSSRKAYRP